jgi:hypothetical protein
MVKLLLPVLPSKSGQFLSLIPLTSQICEGAHPFAINERKLV